MPLIPLNVLDPVLRLMVRLNAQQALLDPTSFSYKMARHFSYSPETGKVYCILKTKTGAQPPAGFTLLSEDQYTKYTTYEGSYPLGELRQLGENPDIISIIAKTGTYPR